MTESDYSGSGSPQVRPMASCPTHSAKHQTFSLFYYLSCTHASIHLPSIHPPPTQLPIHPASLTQTCTCLSMCPLILHLPIHPPSPIHPAPLNHICICLPMYPSILHPPIHPPSIPAISRHFPIHPTKHSAIQLFSPSLNHRCMHIHQFMQQFMHPSILYLPTHPFSIPALSWLPPIH